MPDTNAVDIRRLSLSRLCEVSSKLCGIVAEAADDSQYCRGICPGNITIYQDGSVTMRASGSEKPTEEELRFIAPEVFWNGESGPAAVIYSIGMLLYYSSSGGKLPFEGETDPATARGRRLSGKPFSAPENAGKYLGKIIEKATSYRPSDRYRTLAEFRAMLDSFNGSRYTEQDEVASEIFHKENEELTEIEALMASIIGINGVHAEEVPEYEPDPEPEPEPLPEPETGDESGTGQGAEMEEEPGTGAGFEGADENSAGAASSADEQDVGAEELEAAAEEDRAPETEIKEQTDISETAADDDLPLPTADENGGELLAPIVIGDGQAEPLGNKTETSNAEPLRIEPVISFPSNLNREKDLALQMRRRRLRPFIVLLALCSLMLIAAFAVNAYERRNNLIYPAATAEPEYVVIETPKVEIVVTPVPTATPEPVVTHSYEVVIEDISWTEAKAKCEALGGHLVTINNEQEYQYVISLVEGYTNVTKVWIGCHRVDGTLVWENGVDITFYPWANGEPSLYDSGDGVSEDYILMWYHNYGWYYNDSRNDPVSDYPEMYRGVMAYICEYGE